MIDKTEFDLIIDETYPFIIENIQYLVSVVDPNYDFNIEYINQAFLYLLDYTSEDLIGRSFLDFIHSEDLKKVIKILKKRSDLKKKLPEIRIKKKDERFLWFNISVNKFKNNENQQRLLLISRDISDVKNLEDKINEFETKFKNLNDLIPEIQFWKLLSPKKTKEASYFSSKMLQNVIETIPEYIFWKDTNLVYLGCNKNYAKFIGANHPEDIIGKIDEHLTSDKKRIFNLREVELYVMKENKPKYHSAELWITNDGDRLWLDINRIPLQDSKGKVIGMLTTLDDITERTITEQKLKESEERYRLITENAKETIFTLDMNLKNTFQSPSIINLLGYSAEEIMNMTIDQYFTPSSLKIMVNVFKEELKIESQKEKELKRSKKIEVDAIHKNGSIVNLEIITTFLRDKNGKAIGVLGTGRNITKRKKIEQKLKESEEIYRHLFNSTPYAIWLVNLRGIIIDCNSTMDKFMSIFRKEDLIGKSFRDIIKLFLSKGDPRFKNLEKVFKERFKLLLKQGYLDPIEFQISRGDGKSYWITLETSFVKLDNESLIQVFIKNITESKESEIKIKESEEKYRNLVENISDAIIEVEVGGKFEYASPQIFEISGYTAEEMSWVKTARNIHPDDFDKYVEEFKKVIRKGGGKIFIEYRTLHRAGHYVNISLNGRLFKKGKKWKLTGLLRDITKQKIDEEKFKESEEKFRLFVENANDLIVVHNDKFETEYINEPIFKTLLGYSNNDLIGKTLLALIHPDDRKGAVLAASKILRKGKGSHQLRYRHKNGNYMWMEVTGNIFLNSKGEKKLITVLRDITIRKRTEQKIKESEDRFRSLVETTSDWIWEVNQNAIYKYVSPKVKDLLGYDPEEIIGKKSFDLMPEDEAKRIGKIFQSFKQSKKPFARLENTYIHKNGQFVVLESSGVPIFNEHGDLMGYRGIDRDITYRKKVEQELRDINRLKSELMTRASHELKTPLISVKWYSDLLLNEYRDRLDSEIISIVESIKGGCERLENLTNDLLESSHLESGQIKLNSTTENLSFLIRFCVKDLKNLAKSRAQTIELKINNNLITNFEKEKIYEVLSNLITNAMKFSAPHGKVNIQTEIKNDFYVVSVNDNGIGFTEEEKKMLFTQFGKIERYGKGWDLEVEGSGLGLFISKKIVELHGGNIWVESDGRNKGSTFCFTLPIITD